MSILAANQIKSPPYKAKIRVKRHFEFEGKRRSATGRHRCLQAKKVATVRGSKKRQGIAPL
ncbi:unnamed protein product [Phytomonas sp. EM1]|nr:unnamed protein product [Phytomonas sp. EM1]|eukprot:CCW60220.1 unnamed protein product [Phytomonas sp. isolate EM1]